MSRRSHDAPVRYVAVFIHIRGTMIFLDFELGFLKDAAQFVDAQLVRLENEFHSSEDPDQFGVIDRGEYVIGLGCVTCQQFIAASCSIIGVSKTDALDLGPKHRSGNSIASILNAAANYWKHSSEWNGDKNGRLTRKILAEVGECLDKDFVLMCVLQELLAPFPLRFDRIVPFFGQLARGSSTE